MATEVVEVLLHRRKVHLKSCSVCATLQKAGDALKAAVTTTLNKNYRVAPALTLEVLQKLVGRVVERCVALEESAVFGNLRAYADKVIDTCITHSLGNTCV